jgi:hypothetical protein
VNLSDFDIKINPKAVEGFKNNLPASIGTNILSRWNSNTDDVQAIKLIKQFLGPRHAELILNPVSSAVPKRDWRF